MQFLIYIAITALSRHLVIDVQKVSDNFHLYLLMSITLAIVLLSLSILILSYTAERYGCPEDSRKPRMNDGAENSLKKPAAFREFLVTLPRINLSLENSEAATYSPRLSAKRAK